MHEETPLTKEIASVISLGSYYSYRAEVLTLHCQEA